MNLCVKKYFFNKVLVLLKYRETRQRLAKASWKDAGLLIVVSFTVVFFIVTSFASAVYLSCASAILLLAAVILAVVLFWAGLIAADPSETALPYARLSLIPSFILLLLIPYNFFYPLPDGNQPAAAIFIVAVGCIMFNSILRRPEHPLRRPPISIPLFALFLSGYALFFGAIAVLRHLNFQDTSSFDVALYNQIQWNNIHGRFYQSSISGSNFVTHNSPFLILLSPLYAVYPHPATLLFMKSIFLTVSAVPFYLILKRCVSPAAIWPLMAAYLFYPFLIGQHFNAPHEVCFLPPFLLFAFYFFLTQHFRNFLIFLFFCLSIKEHMALVSVMFGLYAFLLRRSRRWILTPVIIGLLWAVFSLWIMHCFQQIYSVDPSPAWLIDNIKDRFIRPGHSVADNLLWGAGNSVMGRFSSFIFIYTLLAPVGIVFPLLSPIFFLGLPELLINLLASIPLFYPTWHYNIVVGCFIMVACAAVIGRLGTPFRFSISSSKIQQLCAWFICLCVLSHCFLWRGYLRITRDPAYLNVMKEAIALIPEDASVSAPKHLVSHVSTRNDYFLLQDNRKGDYILVDQNKTVEDIIQPDGKTLPGEVIFEKDGVRVYRKQ